MMSFFIMVIDCSQITAVLCDIQILTAVLTAIIVGLLKKDSEVTTIPVHFSVYGCFKIKEKCAS